MPAPRTPEPPDAPPGRLNGFEADARGDSSSSSSSYSSSKSSSSNSSSSSW
jgi:hypothetical protein